MNQNNFFQDMNNKIVDSHCHLSFKDFDEDRDLIIENARLNNVEFLLNISVNLEEFEDIHKITEVYEKIWCTTGIHPNNVPKKLSEKKIEELKNIISSNIKKTKVIGIGETGLDFFRSEDNKKNQIISFDSHMEISGKNSLPTIVHTRDTDNETHLCIQKAVKNYSTKGLIHCFTSTKDFAKLVLDCGFYISFSGIITFKNATDLHDVVKYVPEDRILVETDSPYLAPVPYRGKRNEPSYVTHTLQKIAELKKIDVMDLTNITTNNFFKLFSRI